MAIILFIGRKGGRIKSINNKIVLGPHIWNSLPEEIKQLSSLNAFKNYIKSWSGQKSKCYLCQNLLNKHLTP